MKRIELLDHGYVEFIESWGGDERFIEAARMSTGKGFEGWDKDAGLLAYLYNNKHSTPFEMGGLVIEVKAPIFVFREWHRHRTQSYNEMSGRYVPLPHEDYLPALERCLMISSTNKQAGNLTGAAPKSHMIQSWLTDLEAFYEQAQRLYEDGLTCGVSKELARCCLPVARYSRMRASANLRNWLAFLTLRKAPNAQWEIRQYADAVGELIAEHFPRTWKLFMDDFENG